MNKKFSISVFTIGLAIFTMLFGAGNIIYPIKAGFLAGSKINIGIFGFLLTGVFLPIIGLISMILFDGDYKIFFNRLGNVPGFLAILFCMLIIGPLFVMPRCVTFPYVMLSPFLPNVSLLVFSLLFCLIIFALAYKESQILNILGKYISPFKIGSLALIITLGLTKAQTSIIQTASTSSVMLEQILLGFNTMDLIGALFFAYIIVRLIKVNDTENSLDSKQLALMCLKGGSIAGIIMTMFYVGLSFLSAYYAYLLNDIMNGGEMFSVITLHILGQYGSIILSVAVLMACVSTATALAAVFAEYLRNDLLNKKISYLQSLTIGIAITAMISNFGLSNILLWAAPFINFGYPIIVSIVFCNIAYKLFNFQWIKLPVAITTIMMTGLTLYPYFMA